ncbi:hypothetical protein BDZ89DRAFT_1128636 [Hymenopellis radicata]|nr:hypothetical protein BDZ89DRAFT_1128636 [Hymenopellis radicata]
MLYGSRRCPSPVAGPSEFDLLKASHKFLREDEEDESKESWEDKLASKYYSSLYREFAVCDLKHYKSGNFALRWRTENEVLSGAGETSCGNTRCPQHDPRHTTSSLTTLELPFAYTEHGEAKSALVKTVLCPKCLDKLMWKRRKDRADHHEPSREEKRERKERSEEEDRPAGEREPRRHRRDKEEPWRRRSASPRRRR